MLLHLIHPWVELAVQMAFVSMAAHVSLGRWQEPMVAWMRATDTYQLAAVLCAAASACVIFGSLKKWVFVSLMLVAFCLTQLATVVYLFGPAWAHTALTQAVVDLFTLSK